MNRDQIANAKAFKVSRNTTLSALDTAIAIEIQYIGSEEDGEVQITAGGDLVFIHGDAGSEVADTTIGLPTADGTIDISDTTANTLGEICDAINASPNWRAIRYGRRALSVVATTLLIKSSTTAKTATGLKIYYDTAAGDDFAVCVTGYEFKNFNINDCKVSDGMKTDINVINSIEGWDFTMTVTGDGTLIIYEEGEFDGVKTLWSGLIATTVQNTFGMTLPEMPFIEAAMGKRIIMEFHAATAFAAMTAFNVLGSLVDYSGDRVPQQ